MLAAALRASAPGHLQLHGGARTARGHGITIAGACALGLVPPPCRQLSASRIVHAQKKKVVILGTGWAGYRLAMELDKAKHEVTVVSPSNHFLFTPLLPSTAVGTLEFRAIQEPVRAIQGLGNYYQAKARVADFENKTVTCQDIFKKDTFELEYDHLVIAAGSKTNTFNTPGVMEREGNEVLFLKHLYHARLLRNRVLECFERAALPSTSGEERQRLLTFVVVGGGPTSCELVGCLHDFLNDDVAKCYTDLRRHIKVHLIEAGPGLLGSFDNQLVHYVTQKFEKRGIHVRTSTAVTEVFERHELLDGTPLPAGHHMTVARLGDGTEIPFGLMLWSAGLEQVKFVSRLDDVMHGPSNRLQVDGRMRLLHADGTANTSVSAIGDCAINTADPLVPLAQVAEQQAIYLACQMNTDSSAPFQFRYLGSMANIGGWKGVLDASQGVLPEGIQGPRFTGVLANLVWHGAYWTGTVSFVNKILILMYWFKAALFGRDISRF